MQTNRVKVAKQWLNNLRLALLSNILNALIYTYTSFTIKKEYITWQHK